MVVLYASNSGYTEQYAKLLAKELDVPAYNIKNVPDCHKGKEVVFLGWIMAGSIVDYKKAAGFAKLKCVAGVGMGPPMPDLVDGFRSKNKIPASTEVFYLQGGFDINKLHGPFKLIMKLKVKEIAGRLNAKPDLTPEEQATLTMTQTGYSCVCKENLASILAAARK